MTHRRSFPFLPLLWIASALVTLFASDLRGQQGSQVNLDPASGLDLVGDAGNEPSLAISPVDSNRIVVGWRLFPTVLSNARKAGVAFSMDGGQSFVPLGHLSEPLGFPPTTEQTDPVVDVDRFGVFSYWSEVFVPSFANYHYQSFDGGVTWPAVHAVEIPATSGDKGWMVIDRTGGQGDGHIYGGWNNFQLGGQCFVRSLDGGQSFAPAVRIADAGGTQWMLHMAVGPDGELYAAWRNYNDNAVYITKSLNAKDGGAVPTFDAFGGGGMNGLDLKIDDSNDPGFPNLNPVGFHQVFLAVDASATSRRGWVYILWADDRHDVSDVLLARSMDGGFSWETGIRVHDDVLGNGAYQWMPAMSVAPNGRLDVVWYDTRNDPGNPVPHSELYYSFSLDGGSSWSADRRISDAFDTTLGYPDQQKIGDYIQSVSLDGHVNVAYAATFNGGQDVFFLRVPPTLLDVGTLVAGQNATITMTGGNPQQMAWLTASLQGPGNTYVPALNTTLGLANPFLAGGAQLTDANGDTVWNLPVPGGASGMQVWLQAAQVEGGSQVENARIL